MIELIEIMLTAISCAALGIEIAYHSNLAYHIKRLLLLDLNSANRNRYKALSSINFWIRLLGGWLFTILIPFVLVIVIIMSLYHWIGELVNCPWCISYWICLFANIYILELATLKAILFSSLALVGVTLIENYLNKNNNMG